MTIRFLGSCLWLVAVLGLLGCKPSAPTSAWLTFHPETILSQTNREGGFGGDSHILWKTEKEGTFKIDEIKRFAESNDWNFVSEALFPSREVGRWKTWSGTKVFPLGFSGLNTNSNVSETYDRFPRSIDSDCVLLKFDTHWIIAISGTNEPAYAYMLVSMDGREMALYHLWGE